ncbi:MAG TPA: translocase [Propionibacteriaceae bacterium]|nr:translocase [Propionibacteriaceae bacterium]
MIDFNASEIVILVILAVIIFGPEKLPGLARKAARVFNYVRNIANDAQGKLRDELGPEFADLNLADLNPKSLVASTLLDPVTAEVSEVKKTLADTAEGFGVSVNGADEAPDDEPEPVPAVVAFDPEAT